MGAAAAVPVAPPGLAVAVYPVMEAPPVLAGAVKPTEAWVSPAVAVPMVGAPGTTALTAKERDSVGAAFQAPLPAWSASMVQEPGVMTGSADVEVALSVGVVPKFCAPWLPNVIVWLPLGVTALDAADDTLVQTALVAV